MLLHPPHVSPSTGREKPDLRRSLLSRRDALTERERTDKSAVICARAGAAIAARCEVGAVVALYAHKGSEVETTALDEALRAAGFHVVYPRVIDGSRVLAFYDNAIGELAVSRWGLREPAADAARAVGLEAIAAFVIPGVAFDRGGGRLGWGKGHYDATLAARGAAAVTIGLAFECQIVDAVTREAHDVPLDCVITEHEREEGLA